MILIRHAARFSARADMGERPILLFDSGVGGLSVLAAVRDLLPRASLVYVADSAGIHYGTKSEGEIAARVPALLGRLAERYDPRLIVIACNTASTIALGAVRAALDLPDVGTVPAIKPAAENSDTRVIGAAPGFGSTCRTGGCHVARRAGRPSRLSRRAGRFIRSSRRWSHRRRS